MSEDKQTPDAKAPPEWTGTIQIKQTSPIRHQTQNTDDNRMIYYWGLTWYEFVSACMQAGILLVTFVYVVTAILQWLAIKESVRLTKQSLEVSQRAWVFVKEMNMLRRGTSQPIPPDELSDITITYENSGNTPALNFSINVNVRLDNKPLPKDFDYPDATSSTPTSRSVLAPKSQQLAFASLRSARVFDETSGELFLHVWERITYEDVFQATHNSEFCFRYKKETGHFTACPEHYKAD